MRCKKIFGISLLSACLLMGVSSPTSAAESAGSNGVRAALPVYGIETLAGAPTAAEAYTLTVEDVDVFRCREDDNDSNTPFIDAVSISWKGGVDLGQPKYKNIVIPDTLPFDKPVLDAEGREQTDQEGKVITVTVNMPVIKAYLNPGESGRGNLEKVTVSKNVRALGDFYGCEKLGEVVIPEDSVIDAFSADAFSKTAIQTLLIPANVKELPERMFYECKNLTNVTFAEGSTLEKLGAYVFAESGLKSIDLPDNVTAFGEYAFHHCALEEVSLPDAMEEIPQYAFAYCTSLKKVAFGSGLTVIGDFAFQDTAIEELDIPDHVLSIGRGAFNNIEALKSVKIGSGIKELGGCLALGDDGVICVPCFQNDVNIETLVLSEGLEKIGDEMFKWSGKIKDLVIPSTVKNIGKAAFGGFNGISGSEIHALSNLTFAEPSQLENIFEYAFCFSSIRHLTLPVAAKPFKIWDDAFEGSGELLDVDLGNCRELGSDTGYTREELYETNAAVFGAFKGCAKLREVKLGNELEVIHHGTFLNCESLLGPIVFPENLKKIGHSAFEGCSLIDEVTFNEGLTTIGNQAFCGCDLQRISLPDTVTAVGNRCFEGNVHAESVKFSARMTVIPNRFLDCYSEANAGYAVAHGSKNGLGTHGILKELIIPANIKEIGIDAFDGCLDLETLDLGQVEYIGTGAFSCHDLLTEAAGRLGSLKTVVMSPALKEIGTLPPSCTEMESAYAEVFHGQGDFEGLVLPATLEKVGAYALAGCKALKELTMTDKLKFVGSHAFDGCVNLKALAFAENADTRFEEEVFKDCKGVTRVTLPAWMETVPVGIFSGCRNLSEVALSEGISELGGMAFANTGLTNVTLPESCRFLGESAFQNAPVQNVTLGSKTVSIGANAFVRDTRVNLMASVYIPETVRLIGEKAFGYYKDTDKGYEELCAEAARLEAETGEQVDVQSLLPPTIANHNFVLYGGERAKSYAEENEMIYGGTDPSVPVVREVESIALNSSALTLKVGESYQLSAEVLPENAVDAEVSWKSGATKVVKVSKTGKLTAVAAGTATIRAMTANGTKAFCYVTVKAAGVTKVTLNKTSASTNVGLTVQLRAAVTPSDAEDKTITWKSSDTRVAKVSKSGLVTAVRCGSATITATAASGVKATCKVTVRQKYVYECAKDGVYRYVTSTATVKKLKADGWSYKKAFRVPGKSQTPVYSIYNKTTKRYQYTADKAVAVAAKKAGNKSGLAFYGSASKSIPVYELCKEGKRPTYYYTTSKTTVKAMKKKGWTYMGIGWYAELKTLE